MLNYSSLTKAANGFSAFMGVPSLKAMGASARATGRGAFSYGINAMNKTKMPGPHRRQLSMGSQRLKSQLGGYFSGRDMGRRGLSRGQQYGVGAARAGGAMAAADFLNPFGLGFND